MTLAEKLQSLRAFFNAGDNLYHWAAKLTGGQEYHSMQGYKTAQEAEKAGRRAIEIAQRTEERRNNNVHS